jgi:isocitrate dehydrogenase (NAD+)
LELEVFASLQPVRSDMSVAAPLRDADFIIVREVSEGEYAAAEKYTDHDGDVVQYVSTTTRSASQRVVGFALAQALRTRRRLVTLVHAGPILRLGGGLFADAGRDAARPYDGIGFEVMSVDEVMTKLAAAPTRFGTIVTSGLCGAVVSSLATGLGGGLDSAARMDVSTREAVFSPVHGTAPEIAGKGIANPTAAILAGAMMLRHLGETQAAEAVEAAVRRVVAAGKHLTVDLGGHASTAEVGAAVASLARNLRSEMTSRR